MIFKFEGEILQVFFLFFCCYISIVSNMYLQHECPEGPPTPPHTHEQEARENSGYNKYLLFLFY